MSNKKRIIELIDQNTTPFIKAADEIWDAAELRFSLPKSADILCDLLEGCGFKIRRGLAGMRHAFSASWGEGKPALAILGEYDALPGLNQTAGKTIKETFNEQAPGHGCGHNLLGAGAAAAAAGLKAYMEESGFKGRIVYFGCPAEESGSGKAYMARAGIFQGFDAALTWHPGDINTVVGHSNLACWQVFFHFSGISSHAAGSPERGRSALDAAELMNVGVNYLREHIIQSARIHYAYTDAGGRLPNVVQASAELYYYIRAPRIKEAQEIYERVCDIAKGAALMTGTQTSKRWDSACANYIPNGVLSRDMDANLRSLEPLNYTKEERDFAGALQKNVDEKAIQNLPEVLKPLFPDADSEELKALASEALLKPLAKLTLNEEPKGGSSDVGDVSWNIPTAQLNTVCRPLGTSGHSWQVVTCGKTSIAHKGMFQAAKAIALTGADILENPELLKKAQKEFDERFAEEKYFCPIPTEVQPEE
jgi:aminobenzoyl-glutamate utilization protein B